MTEALKIEVELVEEILEELEKEGQIQGVNPHD
jgi:ribosomal protein S25